MPAAAARLREAGFEPTGMGPDRFNELIRSDFERWSKLIRDNNIRAD
jgi:tripartite-type tricarboxylate transporter receptor subunit TctC